MSGPSVAAVVPATDHPPSLERCVAAIRAADEPPEEIVVVDEPAGAGPAAARNAGVERVDSDVVAFVDSDVVVHRDAFSRLRAAFAADPGLVAVFGSYDDAPEVPGAVSGFRNLLHHHVHQSSPGEARTFWAGLGAVRRDAFLAVGGFDATRYRVPSIEDIELGMRLASSGARIELDPELQGTHLKAWTLADAARTDFARRGVPWVRLLVERRQVPDDLNLAWRHRASAAASVLGLAAVAARRPAAVAAAALALVALNRSFYALLMRRRGPGQAAAGVGLHAIHHAVGAASIPAGLVAQARQRPARESAGRRLLEAFAVAYPEAFFIEIGANDGEQEDHLGPFLRSRAWSGIMVEPVPHVFERLRRNLGDLERVALENAAIADRDGSLPFHHLAPAAGRGDRGGPDWSDTIGSLSRDKVLETAASIPDAEQRLEQIEVEGLSFDSLCRRHGVERLDLLMIDTEGYDHEILGQLDFERLRPRVLVYEYCHMTREQRDAWTARLEALGYETLDEHLDTWCVDVRPDDELTRLWRQLREQGPALSEDELRGWFESFSARRR